MLGSISYFRCFFLALVVVGGERKVQMLWICLSASMSNLFHLVVFFCHKPLCGARLPSFYIQQNFPFPSCFVGLFSVFFVFFCSNLAAFCAPTPSIIYTDCLVLLLHFPFFLRLSLYHTYTCIQVSIPSYVYFPISF